MIKSTIRLEKAIYYFVILQKKQMMAQSLSKLYVHIVFHIKNKDAIIRCENEQELHAYFGGIIKANEEYNIDFDEKYLWS